MKIEYHNLYTHFILITQNRIPSILPKNRERIEKYITGVVNNNHSEEAEMGHKVIRLNYFFISFLLR